MVSLGGEFITLLGGPTPKFEASDALALWGFLRLEGAGW